jgi:hypothetical protein
MSETNEQAQRIRASIDRLNDRVEDTLREIQNVQDKVYSVSMEALSKDPAERGRDALSEASISLEKILLILQKVEAKL